MNKILGDGFIYGDNIFFFVMVTSTENFVDNVPVVGQKNKPLTGFVQSAYRKDPFGPARTLPKYYLRYIRYTDLYRKNV